MKNLLKLKLVIIVSLLFIGNAYAHPHHSNDFIGSLGIDHILTALAVIAVSFFAFGKMSR